MWFLWSVASNAQKTHNIALESDSDLEYLKPVSDKSRGWYRSTFEDSKTIEVALERGIAAVPGDIWMVMAGWARQKLLAI